VLERRQNVGIKVDAVITDCAPAMKRLHFTFYPTPIKFFYGWRRLKAVPALDVLLQLVLGKTFLIGF
jgi:hypothetical protein